MKLEEIKKMVEKDLVIDRTELDIEALKTPQLHGKYLNILIDEKLLLIKTENEHKTLRKYKWLYYTGKISQEELDELEWEPFNLSVLKQDIDKFMDSDDDVIILRSKIEYQKKKIEYLEGIIKTIISRQWLIREAIDWIKFTHGT